MDIDKEMHALIYLNQIVDDFSKIVANDTFDGVPTSYFENIFYDISHILTTNSTISNFNKTKIQQFILNKIDTTVTPMKQPSMLNKLSQFIGLRISKLRDKIINSEQGIKP